MVAPQARSLAVAVSLVFSPLAVQASGFQLSEQGAAGLGMAYAGAAAASWDASTVFWNPAGMTSLPGRQVVAAGNILFLDFNFSDNGSTLPAGQAPFQPRGNGGNGGGTFFIPSAFLTWQLAPQWWAGLGINGPFGLTTKWNDDFVGRFHAIESKIQTYNFNPSIAWKPFEALSIGAGINAMYLNGTFTQYANYAGATAGLCTSVVPQPGVQGCLQQVGQQNVTGFNQGMVVTKGNSWGWGWNVGATVDLPTATRFAITYRSQVTQDVEGDINFNGVPTLRPPLPAGALLAALRTGPVKSEVKLPDTFSFAVAQKLGDRWRILADYTWTGWSSIQELAFVRQGPGAPLPPTELKFKDSWRVGLGAEWQFNDRWLFRAGTAYDRTPVQDEFRTPRLPDNSRWWLSIGGRYVLSQALALDFGYSYLIVQDASINLTNEAASLGRLVGSVSSSTNIIGAQVRWNF
jgi:long-chain fatty acid transport protein